MKTEPQKESASDLSKEPASPALVEAASTKRSPGPWRVLRNRNYALMFWGQLISSSGTQMQVVAVAWQVLLLTHKPVALGVIGLVVAIPRLIFSLVGGVVAGLIDPRQMVIFLGRVVGLVSRL